MISRVVILTVAVPRNAAKRLGLIFRVLLPAATIITRPSVVGSNSTAVPGLMPRKSRIFLGMVTWPLLVT